MNRAFLTTLGLLLTLSSIGLGSSSRAAAQEGEAAADAPEGAEAPAEDVDAAAPAEDVDAATDAPTVDSPAAAAAAAEAEAAVPTPAPAPAYPIPEPAPSSAEGVVYAPPAGANHYPAPERTLTARRAPWPRPGQFAFLVAYAPSIAVGTSSEFASNFGYRGFALGLRYMLNEIFSVGLESGWAYQDDKSRETGSLEGPTRTVTITSGQIRSTEIIPITATAHYYYDAGSVIPHAGLALGAYYTRRDLDAGLWYFSRDGWHFGFSPELGIIIPTGNIQVLTAVRFNYLFESGQSPQEMFFDFRIGILGF